jgi:hypothetical protein
VFKPRLRRLEALLRHLAGGTPARLPPHPLQTPQNVIDLLQEQIELLRRDRTTEPLAKARAIGYLAGLACRTIETGKLADRLEMLERILKQRKEHAS